MVGEHGIPVPQVFDADGSDLVMERIDDPSPLARLGLPDRCLERTPRG